MQVSITPARYGTIGSKLGKVVFWAQKLLRRDRYDRYAIEWVCGSPLVVLPSVFNPRALRSGEFFASILDGSLLSGTLDVLDMGTGTGVCAVFAARHARRVVAIDINKSAVRCARINALLNHVEHKLEVRQGDLFAPLTDERFDLVLFNPPFIRGVPQTERDFAWRSTDVVERFAAELKSHLKPGGHALVLLSTFGDAPTFVREFYEHGFAVAMFAQREFINERLTILKLTHE
jgi:release factor glutamine methyltransferase